MAIKTGITWGIDGVAEGTADGTVSSKTNNSFTCKHTSTKAYCYRSIRFYPTKLLPANAVLTKVTAHFTFKGSSGDSNRAAIWAEGNGSTNYITYKGSLGTSETAVSLTVNASALTQHSDGAYGLGLGGYRSALGTFYWYFSNVYFELEYSIPTINVTVEASPAEGGTVTGGGTYESGTSVTATATPNSGYAFSHWLVNGADSGVTTPTISGVLTADTTVTAVFEKSGVNNIFIGTAQPNEIYIGTQKVKGVYVGTKAIYEV